MVLVFNNLKEKGQISIEFILIVTIALIYINAIVWPSLDLSTKSAFDVKNVADTTTSALKVAGALDEAALSNGDMKKTINVYLPKDANITITKGATNIDYSIYVSNPNNTGFNPMEEVDGIGCEKELRDAPGTDETFFFCKSRVKVLSNAAANLNLASPFVMKGPLFRKLVVEKENGLIELYWD